MHSIHVESGTEQLLRRAGEPRRAAGLLRRSRAGIAGLAVYAAVYIAPLGVRPLFAPDEVRYAEIAREILTSGDWIVPRLNGLRYFEKPILGHWLNALSIGAFGLNPLAIRLTSALSAGLTATAAGLLVWRYRGSMRAVALTVAAYLTMLEVYAIGVSAILDSLLALFTTAGLVAFFRADQASARRERQQLLWLSGVCWGLGLLTKGFIALAIPAVAVVPFLLWEKRGHKLATLGWRPLLAALLVALPWALLIHARESDFWHYFAVVEHWNRFFSASSGQHPQPPWFLLPFVLAGGWPWTCMIPAAIAGWRSRGLDSLGRFALCWLAGPALLFSLSDGKLGTYVLPCFAPLAVLIALGLDAVAEHQVGTRALRGAAWGVGGVCAFGAAAVLANQTFAPVAAQIHERLAELRWPLIVCGLAGCSALAFAALRASASGALACYAAAPLCLLGVAPWVVPAGAASPLFPVAFVERAAADVDSTPLLIAADPSLAYAANLVFHSDDVFVLRRGELAYGLRYRDSSHRWLKAPEVRDFVSGAARERDVVLISELDGYERLRRSFPRPDLERLEDRLAFALFRAGRPARGEAVPAGGDPSRAPAEAQDQP